MSLTMKIRNLILMCAMALAMGGVPAEAGEFDVSKMEPGKEPEGVFVIDGKFAVAEVDGRKVVRMGTVPVQECMMLFGDTLRGAATVRVKVRAEKKGRSYPSFGVGLYGVSGHRLRVVPARRVVEVVKGSEVISKGDFAWKPDAWTWVELSVTSPADGKWSLEGRAWTEGAEAPVEPLVRVDFEAARVMGKAGILGTPYSGLPTLFDAMEVKATE
jgi:hypothetical protein